MKNIPVLLNLEHKSCLLVGGGTVATRRARALMQSGILIDLVSIDAAQPLLTMIENSGGAFAQRAWQEQDISDHYEFVIVATDDKKTNHRIAEMCKQSAIRVNVASDSTLSDIWFPLVIDRDPIQISVSGGGASPVLAKLLANRIDALIPAGYSRLAELVARYRHRVNATLKSRDGRATFWGKVLTGSVAESIFSGNPDIAEKQLNRELSDFSENATCGEVYLIGAGPGDPDLLTFRAYRLLQMAEVVLYDRLISDRILEQANPDAIMIYVGKKRANHSMAQGSINQTLIDYASSGKRVARLKGGDPFIFGRGGEEIEHLTEHQIPFQVVPGITAASGCACYSGIPLTHRDHAQSVRFVTGQLKDGSVNLPWEQLTVADQTVVIYMGLVGLPIIARQLMAHGMSADTPAAMIEQGTTLDQKVHCSTIQDLPEVVRCARVQAPTLLIIGSVVSLHQSLNWFRPA